VEASEVSRENSQSDMDSTQPLPAIAV
jgi:hypothetical protein